MRSIMVLNAKGGCGKSTLATNIASFFATKGKQVALADYDPQASSLAWLEARAEDRPPIHGIAALDQAVRPPKDTDILVIDPPARIHGKDLTQFVRKAQTIVIPVLPSPMDIRAAENFIDEVQHVGRVERKEVKLALVGNRVRENTLVAGELNQFLKGTRMSFLTILRDTQNYIRAAERGLGIFEMAPSQVGPDLEQWAPLTRWLSSKRSIPDSA